MRKGLITLLCVAGLMLWGVTTASATDLDWTLLMHSSVAGKGPGSDGVIGTSDDTSSGENNSCNFSVGKNCAAGSTPALGSYSATLIEYTNPTWYSCLDITGGPYAGAPCVCAEPAGQPCQSDAQCESGTCAGAGDCCPGIANICTACTDNPSGYDSYSYFGIDAGLGPAPNMTTCQSYNASGTNYEITAYQVATSESIAGSGGACIKLVLPGGPYLANGCGVGAITGGSIDVDVYIGGCVIKGTTINGIAYNGDLVDMDAIAAASSCGYNYAETVAMVNNARSQDPTAEYLMVMCGQVTVPMTSGTACLRGAVVDFMVVAHTPDDATSCPASACP
jgi:hypothetical protein